jgi:hypothetical protein
MGPAQHYLIVLQQDSFALALQLVWVMPAMLVQSLFVALAAGGRQSRLEVRLFLASLLIAWLVAVIAAVASYLLGWGLAIQLYRTFGVGGVPIPQPFFVALLGVSFVIAVVLSYRHTAAWLRASAPLENSEASVTRKPSPLRASFSLGTLVLYQLIFLLGIGLWIECRRDWVLEQYMEQARLQAYLRWSESIEKRFGGNGWKIEHSGLDDPTRWLRLNLQRPSAFGAILINDPKALDFFTPDDGLVFLSITSPQLTDASLKRLTRVKSIQGLFIKSPALTDEGVAELAKFPDLKFVSLDCDNLTVAAFPALAYVRANVQIQSVRISQKKLDNFNRGVRSAQDEPDNSKK